MLAVEHARVPRPLLIRLRLNAEQRPEVQHHADDHGTASVTSARLRVTSSGLPLVEPDIIRERVAVMTKSRELTEAEAIELARRDLCATCRAAIQK